MKFTVGQQNKYKEGIPLTCCPLNGKEKNNNAIENYNFFDFMYK